MKNNFVRIRRQQCSHLGYELYHTCENEAQLQKKRKRETALFRPMVWILSHLWFSIIFLAILSIVFAWTWLTQPKPARFFIRLVWFIFGKRITNPIQSYPKSFFIMLDNRLEQTRQSPTHEQQMLTNYIYIYIYLHL